MKVTVMNPDDQTLATQVPGPQPNSKDAFAPSNSAIHTRGLLKDRGRFRLGPLDIDLPCGQVLGLVGPNGSGKTTLIKLLLGMIATDAGEAAVLGSAPGSLKEHVCAALDADYLLPDWTVQQVYAAVRRFYPRWNQVLAGELLEQFHIPVKAKVKELSRGETSKLKLLLALAPAPELLILDEPTSGLDPLAREEILRVIREFMLDESHSVLLSTHIPSDLSTIADSILVLREGSVAHQGPMDEFTESYFAVHGANSDLPEIGDQLIGTRRTASNFTAVVRADQTAGLPASVVVEQANVDDIVKALAVTTAQAAAPQGASK